MVLWQAILVAFLYYFADAPFFFGEGYYVLQRPVVAGLLVGLVMGDPVQGVIIGATINLIFLGHMSVGGSIPSDMALGGYVGTAIALSQGLSFEQALALAVPISVVGGIVWTGRMTISAIFAHWADNFAAKGDAWGVRLMNWLPIQIILFLFKMIVVSIGCYYGAAGVGALLANFSGTWFFVGLGVIGGMLPAIGIALNLRAILKKETWPFLIFGFLMVTYFGSFGANLGVTGFDGAAIGFASGRIGGVTLIGVALFGAVFAAIYILLNSKHGAGSSGAAFAEEGKSGESRLEKRDIQRSYWLWQFFSHANYNYERMQGTAFAMAMSPVLEKLYTKKEELSQALQRHLVFFNTDPNIGSLIHGATIAMEEQRASGADIDDDAINSFKTGLMGPLAGVGDSLVQGIIIPLVVAIGISISLTGNVMGSILVLIGLPIILMCIAYNSWMQGYSLGGNAISSLLAGGRMKVWLGAAGILGTTVMGALIPSTVSLRTTIAFNVGEMPFDLQSGLFDSILPGLLPLALTIFCYWLTIKQVKTWQILVGAAVVGFAGGALRIFG
ncbi:MAG: PTS system mannose/fructose/sorbose family transporter subunit IID [Treponema sp.]|jgi:mannose/fructose/N-acetylgalactosamine-specific phosphotransferase system component IID|nr:PTS system mannose/fructose/sorbose family transporter subunit IID [Treponema sp.]